MCPNVCTHLFDLRWFHLRRRRQRVRFTNHTIHARTHVNLWWWIIFLILLIWLTANWIIFMRWLRFVNRIFHFILPPQFGCLVEPCEGCSRAGSLLLLSILLSFYYHVIRFMFLVKWNFLIDLYISLWNSK